jgi:hypothetical protein
MPSVVLSTSHEAPTVTLVASATGEPAAGWATGTTLVIVTRGSSGCPLLPTEVTADGAHRIRVTTSTWTPPGSNACTSDSAPTSTTIASPAGIDPHSAVTVTVDGTDLALPPAP